MIFLVLSIFVLGFFRYTTLYKNKWAYVFTILCVLAIIPCFRLSEHIPDIKNYTWKFELFSYLSYEAVAVRETKDTFFYFVAKALCDFGCSASLWLFLIGLLFSICVSVFIYRESDDPYVSFVVLLSLFFFFTLSGLRQTVALGIIMACSYKYMEKRKLFPFLLSIVVAALFHTSAILFLPAYWICRWKLGVKQIALIVGALVVSIFFSNLLRTFINRYAWGVMRTYAYSDIGLSWSGFVIQMAILVFCLYQYARSDEKNEKLVFFLNCMIIGLCIQSFASVIGEAFRVSFYYSISSIAAIPLSLNTIKSIKAKNGISFAVILILFLYIFVGEKYVNLLYI